MVGSFGWNDNCVLDPFANSGFNFPAASPSPSFESAAKKSPLRRQGVTMNRGNIFGVYHVHVLGMDLGANGPIYDIFWFNWQSLTYTRDWKLRASIIVARGTRLLSSQPVGWLAWCSPTESTPQMRSELISLTAALHICVFHKRLGKFRYRDRLKCLYVVARNLFLLLLSCSARPCLGPA